MEEKVRARRPKRLPRDSGGKTNVHQVRRPDPSDTGGFGSGSGPQDSPRGLPPTRYWDVTGAHRSSPSTTGGSRTSKPSARGGSVDSSLPIPSKIKPIAAGGGARDPDSASSLTCLVRGRRSSRTWSIGYGTTVDRPGPTRFLSSVPSPEDPLTSGPTPVPCSLRVGPNPCVKVGPPQTPAWCPGTEIPSTTPYPPKTLTVYDSVRVPHPSSDTLPPTGGLTEPTSRDGPTGGLPPAPGS